MLLCYFFSSSTVYDATGRSQIATSHIHPLTNHVRSSVTCLAQVVVSGMLLVSISGCSLKSLFESPNGAGTPPTIEVFRSKVMQPPLIANRAAPAHLRELRRIIVSPIYIAPAADSARSYGERFDQSLAKAVGGLLGLETIASTEAREKASQILAGKRTTHDSRIELMQTLKGNAVLETVITRFQERLGSRIGSDSPAQVGVHYLLYQDGRDPIWEATFHFTDIALTDNLLSADNRFSGLEGAGWKGAPSLVEESMRQALSNLESQRANSFTIQ